MHYHGNPEYPPDIDMITVELLIKIELHQVFGKPEHRHDPAGKE
jgi:hypothetical protein